MEYLSKSQVNWPLRELSLRYADCHAVEAGLDMGWQFLAQNVVVEIGVQVGENGARRLEPVDPAERVGEGEMTRMRPVAQRVDDPDFEIGQSGAGVRRHAAEVAGIGEIADATAERGN